MAAQLHTRIQGVVDAEVELKDEVAVVLLRAEEGVIGVHLRVTDDGAVFYFVDSLSAALRPSTQVLTIEKILPLLGIEGRR